MKPDYLQLGTLEMILAASLMTVNLLVSWLLRLGMTGRLVWASLRMAAQLLLVGLILEWVFAQSRPEIVLGIAMVMAGIAGVTAVGRTSRRFAGAYWDALVTIIAASFLVTGLATAGILRLDPWYEPQYFIPMLGMVLGNALTGISLGMDRFLENMVRNREMIEVDLASGATGWQAVHIELQDAVRTGMIPILNAMLVMGVVSLPGMMTGQILAGAAPVDAVRYQIVIVFMIAAAVALGTIGMVLLAFRRTVDRYHRLRVERIFRMG